MGQRLCCLRPSNTDQNQPKNVVTSSQTESLSGNKMTLQDCLAKNSPSLKVHHGGGHENVQVFKQTRKRVYPSSPADGISSPCYYTPRASFSLGRMDRIDEFGEDINEEKLSASCGSGKLKKRVTFSIPEKKADITIFYSPKETFD